MNTTALFRGKRNYELSNHLGNVQMVISDKRKSVCDEELGVEYFVAEVLSAVDYYPFGALMPDRQWYANNDSSIAINGFNGMRNDHEINGHGNALDFGARVYDSRLGRWASVDPMAKGFPFISPYHFAGNNPQYNIDKGGAILQPYDAHSQEILAQSFMKLFDSDKNKGKMAALLIAHMSPDGSLNLITKKEFRKALKGLSPEQKQLAKGYFDVINTDDKVIVLIGKGGDPIPTDFFPSKGANRVANGKNIVDITSKFGGGATVVNDHTMSEMNDVIASVLIQEDADYANMPVKILDQNGIAVEMKDGAEVLDTKGNLVPLVSHDYSLDELVHHETIGHALLGGVYGKDGSADDLASIQVSNIYRRDKNLPFRSGIDHKIGVESGKPKSDVTAVPKELK